MNLANLRSQTQGGIALQVADSLNWPASTATTAGMTSTSGGNWDEVLAAFSTATATVIPMTALVAGALKAGAIA